MSATSPDRVLAGSRNVVCFLVVEIEFTGGAIDDCGPSERLKSDIECARLESLFQSPQLTQHLFRRLTAFFTIFRECLGDDVFQRLGNVRRELVIGGGS